MLYAIVVCRALSGSASRWLPAEGEAPIGERASIRVDARRLTGIAMCSSSTIGVAVRVFVSLRHPGSDGA